MLQVIGAGFGRTGTHSLGHALEKLGFGPCYSIPEVSKNPGHTDIWNAAIDGKPIDWDALFVAYRSAVEWPTVAFLSEVIRHFCAAKVVLTLRDPEAWYESANATIFDGLELSASHPDPIKRVRSGMKRRLILERTLLVGDGIRQSLRRGEIAIAKSVRWASEHSRQFVGRATPQRASSSASAGFSC
jgi:hypothetical protein